MKISYNQLQTYFDQKLPTPEKLAEAFTFHAFEVEGIEKKDEDFILDVKVLPDRTCYIKSAEGIAREVTAILGLARKSGMAVAPIARTETMTVSASDINQMLGADISAKEMILILERMDIKAEEKSGELVLAISSDRLDINVPADVADEIGRIYGYENIQSILPHNKTFKPSAEKIFYYCEKIKSILAQLGFSEVYGYSFVPKGDFKIEKPLASDKGYLRTNLADGLAKALELNLKNAELLGLDTIKIFEIGKTFTKAGEKTVLALGVKKVKGKADNLEAIAHAVAVMGKEFGVEMKGSNPHVNIWESNLDECVAKLPEPKSYSELGFGKAPTLVYKKFSLQPFIDRDIALFVPSSVSEGEVAAALRAAARDAAGALLVKGPDCFDRFTKGEKTSFAFRMIFQAFDRTLSDEEVNGSMESIYKVVKAKGWEVR